MPFDLQADSAAGQRAVAAASALLPVLAERAEQADRDNVMCRENIADLVEAGVAAAFVPESLGGFGLESVHDWIALIATLAQGDASAAIALNMHLGVTRGMGLAYAAAQAKSSVDERAVQALAAPLRAVAAGEMLVCATATEPGTDNLHPLTEAVAADDGWLINGHKLFVTMSPIATHLGMNLRMRDDGGDHLVTTLLPINTPGVVPQDDWNALGMRGSGSQSVRFEQVAVPRAAIRKLGPWGCWSVPMLLNRAVANLPLVGAFLGIAQAARSLALAGLENKTRVDSPVVAEAGVQHLAGEMEIELAKCQAILQVAGRRVDAFLQEHRGQAPTMAAAHDLMKDYQAAKWVVNRGAIDIVSMAMDLLGGAGYSNAHPLARLYRDVRAGPFMQPFSPTEAREYVGRVALQQWPED